MDEHTDIAAAQWQVQRWLGRCVLVLQQYEGLMKSVIAHHELSGPASELSRLKHTRVEAVAANTLGQSVGKFVGSFLVNGDRASVEPAICSGTSDVVSISFRINVSMSETDYVQTQASLKELVDLRNGLVHHFIERFDLWSIEGCEKARAYLQGVYARVVEHFEQLRVFAGDMKEAVDQAISFMQSDAGIDLFVNGISPDGQIRWPTFGIVRALRDAAHALAIDGWTALVAAKSWLAEHHPEQQPVKYRCRSWSQVLHESRCFELRYRIAEDGARIAWFRPN
jgi:hypothetical protein